MKNQIFVIATCQICGSICAGPELDDWFSRGFIRENHYCYKCHNTTEHKIEGINMSQETLNPELNQTTQPSSGAPAADQGRPALLAGVSDEHLGMVLSVLGDTAQAIADIPAQIELLSRCTLAQAFVYRTESGQTSFAQPQFEKAWLMISEPEEKAG